MRMTHLQASIFWGEVGCFALCYLSSYPTKRSFDQHCTLILNPPVQERGTWPRSGAEAVKGAYAPGPSASTAV